jgi:hypothetical protein
MTTRLERQEHRAMNDTIPTTCDKCGCTPTVDPETDVIDLVQVCGITLGVQLDREHWLCSTCAAEFGGGTDYDEELAELTRGISSLCSETESGHAYEPGVVVAALEDVLSQRQEYVRTSWALDRLSILVTALQCFAGGESPGQVAAFGRPAAEQEDPSISYEDLTTWDIQRMLDALGLTEEQQEALDNR